MIKGGGGHMVSPEVIRVLEWDGGLGEPELSPGSSDLGDWESA